MKIKVRKGSKPIRIKNVDAATQFHESEVGKAQAPVESEPEADFPMPPHIGKPVGPLPPPVELPTTIEGFIELAKAVGKGAMVEKANLWAQIAQAMAQKRVGDLLEELVVFTGARDGVTEDVPRLTDVLELSLVDGVLRLRDELSPQGDEEIAPDGGNVGEMLRADMEAYVASTAAPKETK